MREVMDELVSQLDLLESQSTKSFGWKPAFDQIMNELGAINAAAASQQHTNATPLFRLLYKQNELISALFLLVMVARQQK